MTVANLRDLLNEHFDTDELRRLCFDLSIEYENLPGDTRIAKAQALVEHCLRHGRLPDLGRRCGELRPMVEWPDLDQIAGELDEVLKTARALKQSVKDEELLLAMLAPLGEKSLSLRTQLFGSGVAAQGTGAKALEQVVLPSWIIPSIKLQSWPD